MSDPIPTSLTVDSLPPERRPGGTTCEGCQHAVWYTLEASVHCNCLLRHTESYSSAMPQKLVKDCDGRRKNSDLSDFVDEHGGAIRHPNSVTVDTLPAHRKPGPTMCQSCPSAIWYALPQSTHCDCRLMGAESYSSAYPQERITRCDGILVSTQQLLRRQGL